MQRRLITFAVMVATFLAAMDTMVVGTAMPTVIGALGGLALYSWVFSAYLLTSTVTVPIYGKMADLHGRKPVFIAGTALFLLGSALSGASQNMEQLIIFRTLQGLGAGAVIPITIVIIGDLYPLEERARMMGLFSGIWGLSSLIGPALGGLITDSIGWRWVFYVNLPIGAAAILLIWLFLHEHLEPRPHSIDFAGAFTLAGSVTVLMLGLQLGGRELAWTSWQILALLGGAAALLWAFTRVESRSPEPLLPRDLLQHYVLGPANVVGFLMGAAMFGLTTFVPAFVQGVLGGSASTAGATLAVMSLVWTAGSTLSGRLMLSVGYRLPASLGMGMIVAGTAALSLLDANATLVQVLASMAVVGLGLGFTTATTVIAVQNAVPWAQRGTATSAHQFFRTIGGAVGVSLVGAVFAAALASAMAALGMGADILANASSVLDPQSRATLQPEAASAMHTALGQALHVVFLAHLAIAAVGLMAALRLPGGPAGAHAWHGEEPAAPWEHAGRPR